LKESERLEKTMSDSEFNEKVMRPAMCPFCKSKVVDTLAKVITATTFWRCRACDGTWTIASMGTSRGPSH
jgi:ribosomal protein L37AE/L43A